MLRALFVVTIPLFALTSLTPVYAFDSERDFSGEWILDPGASNTRSLSEQPDQVLAIFQHDAAIRCSATPTAGSPAQWSYALDGNETRYRIGEDSRNSVVKWEGSALLINTLVSGPRNYTVMDRWKLSRDHSTLTINRQEVRSGGEGEGVLVYRRKGAPVSSQVAIQTPPHMPASPASPTQTPQPALARQPDPPAASELSVRAGTRIPLSLRNTVDTKHSREGDRIYLETIYPIARDGHIVIPRGSFVNGTVTESKAAGKVKGKGELYIRFDTLILPNGITRDFRSRLGSADGSAVGEVDRKEGKVTGQRDKSDDARTVAEGAGIGASVGGIAGAAAGHAIKGVGIGAAAGAAAGLAGVFLKHRPDAVLPRGTTVEMVLDRDLRFSLAELGF